MLVRSQHYICCPFCKWTFITIQLLVPVCSCIVYGCFQVIVAELSSCDRDYLVYTQPKALTIWPLKKVFWPLHWIDFITHHLVATLHLEDTVHVTFNSPDTPEEMTPNKPVRCENQPFFCVRLKLCFLFTLIPPLSFCYLMLYLFGLYRKLFKQF